MRGIATTDRASLCQGSFGGNHQIFSRCCLVWLLNDKIADIF